MKTFFDLPYRRVREIQKQINDKGIAYIIGRVSVLRSIIKYTNKKSAPNKQRLTHIGARKRPARKP